MSKATAKVTNVRKAGRNHQVVTVEGGGKNYRKMPCAGCPWRVDQTGQFPASAFKHSANTAYDLAGHTFACHEVGMKKPAICAGFLLRGSQHNMAVRLMLMKGEIDPKAVSDGGCELHESYRDMAIANGVRPGDPSIARCR